MKKLFKYLKKYIPLIVLSLVSALLTVVMQLYIPILIGQAVDLIISKGNVDFYGVYKILKKMAFLILGASFFQWLMSLINNKVAYSAVFDIRVKAFNKIQELPISYIDSHQHGDIMSRITTDIDQMSDGLLMGFSQFFTGIITIAGTLIYMFTIDVKNALIVVLLTPLSIFVASFVAKKTYKMFLKQSEKRAEITALIDEMVGNEKVVQAFSYEDTAKEKFEKANDELTDASFKATFFSSLTNPSMRFVNNLIYAAVGIIGAYSALSMRLTVGQITSFLSYANQYMKPFNEISNVLTELQNALACFEHVVDFIEEEPEISDAEGKILPEISGNVEFENVTFSYDKNKELIKDLSICVKPGMRAAIVGPTGCGKSTLINLIMRFYDVDGGAISVDGFDIRDLKRESLRAGYGMVLQETWLKSGTVRDNITFGRKDASDEEVRQAAIATHADEFIRKLPNGYDTFLSEDGGSLSDGQRQMLCITRVMLNLPPMLILDEATSSIDTRTEKYIQESFSMLMKGRTSFIVAHRLSTIMDADIILVMKDGNIIEQGRHEELLEKGGFYKRLYESGMQPVALQVDK